MKEAQSSYSEPITASPATTVLEGAKKVADRADRGGTAACQSAVHACYARDDTLTPACSRAPASRPGFITTPSRHRRGPPSGCGRVLRHRHRQIGAAGDEAVEGILPLQQQIKLWRQGKLFILLAPNWAAAKRMQENVKMSCAGGYIALSSECDPFCQHPDISYICVAHPSVPSCNHR